MADRFKRLYELPNNLYSSGSPVIVSGGALLKDNESGSVLVQLKFQSITAATIKAVSVDIAAFDVTGQKLAAKNNYQYLDLSTYEGDYFGSNKAVVMPDATTRSFEITRIVVVLKDGSTVNVALPLTSLPKETSLSSVLHEEKLVRAYRTLACEKALFVPIEEKGLWQCACGKWNCGPSCTQCHAWKKEVFSKFNIDYLRSYSLSGLLTEPEDRKNQEKAARHAHRFLIAAKIFCVLALLVEVLFMFFAYDTNYTGILYSSSLCAVSYLLLLLVIGKNTILTQAAFIGLAIGGILYSKVDTQTLPYICNTIVWGLMFLTSIKGLKAKLK